MPIVHLDTDAHDRYPSLGFKWYTYTPETTSLDILRDEGRAYAQALITKGNRHVVYQEVQGLIHGYYLFCGAVPSCIPAVDAFLATLKAMIATEIALQHAA